MSAPDPLAQRAAESVRLSLQLEALVLQASAALIEARLDVDELTATLRGTGGGTAGQAP